MNAFHSKIELEIDLTPSERELVLSVFPKGAMIGAAISSGIGSAVYIAIVSALYKKNLKVGLAVLGNISVGGAIERVINFADKVTMLSENGAKSVIVPMDNLPELSNVPPTVLGNTDVPFYQNNQMLHAEGYIAGLNIKTASNWARRFHDRQNQESSTERSLAS